MTRSVPTKLRWSILHRDGFRCTYCGAKAADGVQLHVDHIVAWVDGGTDDPANLTTACDACNLGKSDTSLRRPKLTPPEPEAEILPGAMCITRLRIAAIASRFGMSYRKAWGASSPRKPPPDRYDEKWVAMVKSDPMRFDRWLAELIDRKLAGDGSTPPFA